jgi:putative two-component system response regulator
VDKKVVLVIDDATVSLLICRSILQSFFEVRLFKSAKQALERLEAIRPDIILLDIEMPDMTGFEALKALRDNPANPPVPVIFVTAHMDPEFVTLAMDTGVDGYVVKPFNPEVLVKRVNTVLDEFRDAHPLSDGAPVPPAETGAEDLPALKHACLTGDIRTAEALAAKLKDRNAAPDAAERFAELQTLIKDFDWDLAAGKIDTMV